MKIIQGKIYLITNKVTGKQYVGQTIQPLQKRWNNHKSHSKNRGEGSYLYRAIQKYGIDNFIFEQIDSSSTLEGLNLLEQMYIKKFNTLSPFGYNLETGGATHEVHQETRQKISQTLKGRPIKNRWNGGNHTSPSKETREKIAEKLKGRSIKNRWTGGNTTPMSEEQKKHLSQLNKGKPNVALYKKVLCVETGQVFNSVNETAKFYKINRVTISNLIKTGKSGRLNLHFRFLKE